MLRSLTNGTPARRRIVAAFATTAAVALTASACGTSAEDIAETMEKPVSAHEGTWTETALRDAAGDHADKIVAVSVLPDATGGTVYFEVDGHDKGDKKSSSSSSSKKKRKSSSSKTYSDWEVDCVKVEVTGTSLTSEEYERESSTEPVSCAD